MKNRRLHARSAIKASRQVVLQPSVENHIRWPILLVVCVTVAGVFALLFSIQHPSHPDANSVEQSAIQSPSDVIDESIGSNADESQGGRNGGIHLPGLELSRNVNKELIEHLSALAASAGMTEEVETAIHGVATLGDGIVPELKRLLEEDQNPPVREAAARTLAEMGTRASIATLLAALLSEQDGEQRHTMAGSLHALNSPAAAAELTAALMKSQDPIIAPTLRDTLARVADAEATRTIAQAFHSDAYEGWQQSNLMGALLRVSSGDAVPALLEIVSQDTDPSFGAQAAIALARIGTPEAVASLIKVIEERPVTDVDDLVVQALLSVDNKDAEVPLYEVYQNTTNAVVKYATAEALVVIQRQTSEDTNAR